MGIHHEVVEQKFDEDSVKDLDPIVCSQNIVKGKNISARQLLVGSPKENLPILTADTLVFTPSKEIVGKPKDYDHSRKLLREFSGKVHSVFFYCDDF